MEALNSDFVMEEMNMIKVKRMLLVWIALLAVALIFSACGNESAKECTHLYGDWVVTKEATCSDKGVQSRVCSVCDTVENKVIPAFGHTTQMLSAVEATCITEGLTEGSYCPTCKEILVAQEVIPAKNHTIVEDHAILPTCITEGKTEGSHCSVCDTVLVEQQPLAQLTSHVFVSGVCQMCGQADLDYIPTYGIGETWIVDGQWEFTLFSAEDHSKCNYKYPHLASLGNTKLVMLTFRYKNIGFGETFAPDLSAIRVAYFDEYSAELYGMGDSDESDCKHAVAPTASPEGAEITMALPYVVNQSKETVSVTISITDANNVVQKARFEGEIASSPYQQNEHPINGSTIIVETPLPQTVSYYQNGEKQHSCTVSDVSFRVDGNQLMIYFSGQKTYDVSGSDECGECRIGWKLYYGNNVIASGTATTLPITTGDGFFMAKSDTPNRLVSDQIYTLVITDVN